MGTILRTIHISSFRCAFLIPAESGEKVTLAISAMLSLIVFLMNVDDGIPQTDRIPIISIFSRQTDRQTDIQTDIQTDRQIDRQTASRRQTRSQ